MSANLRGPMFDGRAAAAVGAYINDMSEQVADAGHDIMASIMDVSFRQPTGYYESQVRVEASGPGFLIHDGGVVYGPWLEGVGSRNNDTRFKGYSMYRRATQALNRDAEGIAERVLVPYLGRMQ